MKKFVLPVVGVLAAVTMLSFTSRSAHAVPPFKTAWEAMYATAGSKIADAAKEAKCNVCHKGTDKKMKNSYGVALGKLLKKADAKDAEKIKKAFEEVAKQKSGGDDSPTFGELISQGKLPGA